jgi:hypothetical protein
MFNFIVEIFHLPIASSQATIIKSDFIRVISYFARKSCHFLIAISCTAFTAFDFLILLSYFLIAPFGLAIVKFDFQCQQVISELHWAHLGSYSAISDLQKFILIHLSPIDFPIFVLNLGHCLSRAGWARSHKSFNLHFPGWVPVRLSHDNQSQSCRSNISPARSRSIPDSLPSDIRTIWLSWYCSLHSVREQLYSVFRDCARVGGLHLRDRRFLPLHLYSARFPFIRFAHS